MNQSNSATSSSAESPRPLNTHRIQQSSFTSWDPAVYSLVELCQNSDTLDGRKAYAVIILNTPLEDPLYVEALLGKAGYIVCADGGANRLHDLAIGSPNLLLRDPHVICGDLDSIRTEVTEYYQSNKFTEFCKDADQYSTDFIKALKVIESRTEAVIRGFPRSSMSKHNTLDVVVLGGLSGRADQAFSQIHHLFVASKMPCFGEVYLVTTNSIVLLLREGSNTIRTQTGPGALTKNIGIIPVGKPSIISTKGLEWDVETWYTEFGGQISTSNHIKGHVVRVDTTEKVLFTAEWAPREQEEPSSDLVSQGKSQGKMRVQTDGLAYAATMEERDRWVSDRLSP